jgi:catechol-2,3-dioxygenase
MSGIVFFGTRQYEQVLDFYTEAVGASVWLEQPDCTILKYDNQLLGFCDREAADTGGIVTFVVDDREAVDDAYDRLREHATEPPAENEHYEIYQFFAEDPEGRTVEVQTFLHPTDPV